MTILTDSSLKTRSSFATGGNADLLVLPQTDAELTEALKKYGCKYVFGNLSNTLITDGGIRGNVIITTGVKGLKCDGTRITAMCGETLSAFAVFACANGLKNAEFCYGIPGSIGGAVFMNAGAYESQISDIIESVTVYSKEKGVFTLNKSEMKFAYRKSIIQEEKYIVISAAFLLENGEKSDIKSKMDELMALRKSKQPLEYPSCGSTFKRPEGHFAGRLIEQCGLKGCKIGGAMVSEKHAGFIINVDNATSDDILALIKYVKETVYKNTGVMLEEEIRIVGE